MKRSSDHLHNLADALSEDVVAMPPEMRAAEVAQDRGDGPGLALAFDRVVDRAERQARWRRIGQRLRALMPSTMLRSWRPALAAVAGLAVVVVVGDVYLKAWSGGPRPVRASVELLKREPLRDDVLASRRLASRNEVGGGVPASAPAASPAARPPTPPAAPPADAPRPVRTVPIQGTAEASSPPHPLAPAKGVRTVRIRPAAEAPPSPPPEQSASVAMEERSLAFSNRANAQRADAAAAARPQAEPRVAAAPAAAGVNQAGGGHDTAPSFAWPVRGRVMADSAAKERATDAGIDIAVPAGTEIRAAADGVVTYTGDGLTNFGNLILVRHDGGFVTAYAHVDKILVKVDDRVQRGQVIATSGSSGSAASPLLHFEIRKGSTPVDAKQYLPPE
jgi:murein DD-endopeptidase MepM/ murein hydrolase activator NlpD